MFPPAATARSEKCAAAILPCILALGTFAANNNCVAYGSLDGPRMTYMLIIIGAGLSLTQGAQRIFFARPRRLQYITAARVRQLSTSTPLGAQYEERWPGLSAS